MPDLETLSVVAVLEDVPTRALKRGQVGTIVEQLAPGVYEVEFVDDHGETYALAPLCARQLMPLRYEPEHRAA